jgi:hypothetical protein
MTLSPVDIFAVRVVRLCIPPHALLTRVCELEMGLKWQVCDGTAPRLRYGRFLSFGVTPLKLKRSPANTACRGYSGMVGRLGYGGTAEVPSADGGPACPKVVQPYALEADPS